MNEYKHLVSCYFCTVSFLDFLSVSQCLESHYKAECVIFWVAFSKQKIFISFVRHFMTTSSRASYKALFRCSPKKYFQFLLYNYIYREKCLRLSSNHYRYALILAHASSCVEIPLVLRGV